MRPPDPAAASPFETRAAATPEAPARGPFALFCDVAAYGLIAVLGVIACLTFADYGLGWDDYTHSQYGQLLLDYYASGFSDRRALSFVNLYMYGGGFDLLERLLRDSRGDTHRPLPRAAAAMLATRDARRPVPARRREAERARRRQGSPRRASFDKIKV